jgi:hypothetical protein
MLTSKNKLLLPDVGKIIESVRLHSLFVGYPLVQWLGAKTLLKNSSIINLTAFTTATHLAET